MIRNKIYPSKKDGFFMPLNIQLFAATSGWGNCYETNVDQANNRNNAHVEVVINSSGGTYNQTGNAYVEVTASTSKNSYTQRKNYNIGTNSSVTVSFDFGPFNHNDDGSLGNINLSAHVYVNNSYSFDLSGSIGTSTIPRYATITNFAVAKRDETSVTFSYSTDASCDYAWYSKDNGSTWYDLPSNNIVTGLSANTSYNFKLRVRRKDSQLTTTSGTVQQTTYDYPYCTESPDFVIGNQVTLKFYNPLKREITVNLILAGDYKFSGGKTTGTSLTGFNNDYWQTGFYGSLERANSGVYKVEVIYGSVTRIRNNGNKYSINTSLVLPIFNNFTYRDSNSIVSDVTGNNQIIVQNVSIIEVTIASEDRMQAQKSAQSESYLITMDALSKSVKYAKVDITTELGSLATSGSKRLSVRAYDTRNNSTIVNKDIVVYPYSNPTINASVIRKNNFEEETTIKVNGTYSRLTIDKADKNTITKVQYRYRETGGTWSSWVQLTTTVSNGTYSCNDVLLNLDNTKSFEFEFQVTDKIKTSPATTKKVDVGEGIFAILSEEKCCTINGQKIIMYDIVDTW